MHKREETFGRVPSPPHFRGPRKSTEWYCESINLNNSDPYLISPGSCPLPTKVYGCSPKCTQNYDCKGGKLCCRNGCNAMSCAEPVSNGQGTSGDKYSAGSGVYCNNQKCSPQEVCKQDPATKRMKCVRA
ncbi:hypothetical protein MSG28_013289 [Choristoneura fumiferana]|uniref:Uncharacterized protein n=1 Tax=Choristoneura fumiferana TaxID=7141 RepID=A0ACC0KTE4_CHOFU|nr:hypothetical protein MSG28_013289 [Choristoneura fumiferana]